MNKAIGIAFNGVLIFPSVLADSKDPYYPRAETKAERALLTHVNPDACLGTTHASDEQAYHYYTMSPCITPSIAQLYAFTCEDDPNCKENKVEYLTSNFSSSLQTILPVGLAKDGHIIYGPYRIDGSLWEPCDVDVCNGRFINGYYSYVMTTFHPYTVGCWGPGNNPQDSKLTNTCSNYPRQCPPDGSYSSSATYLSALYMAMLLIFMISVAV